MTTIVTNASVYSAGWPTGQITFQVQFETYVNSGLATPATGVTITIKDPSGTTVIGPVSATALGPGGFQYVWNIAANAAQGDYSVTWAGTRSNDSVAVTYEQYASVALPYTSAPFGCYATLAQYQARTGDVNTPSATVTSRLQLASEQIDAHIVMAVYSTDANGMPLSPRLAVVLMNATIEQCRYLNAKDDDAQAKDEYQSVSVAGISYSRAPNTVGSRMPRICPQAKAILHNAGVLQGAPLVNW